MNEKIASLSSQYLETKKTLNLIESDLKDSIGAKSGDLVEHIKTGMKYRVKYIFIEEDSGIPYASVSEIKNYRINWSSCSVPRLYYGDFKTLEWAFDHAKKSDLLETISNTDSISESDAAKKELEGLLLSCLHRWERYKYSDHYYCLECQSITHTTGRANDEESIEIDL